MAKVRQPDGACLHAFLRPAAGPPPNVPVTGAVTVIRSGRDDPRSFSGRRNSDPGRLLLVFTRDRRKWELPGGSIEPGETPEDCARRETLEESGQSVGALALRGWCVWSSPAMASGGPEACAVYEGTVELEAPFTRTDETERMTWCAPGEEPADLAGIDRAIIDLVSRPS